MMDGKPLNGLMWIPIFIVLIFYFAGILLWFLDVLIVSWPIAFLWPLFLVLVWLVIQAFRSGIAHR